MDQHRRMAPRHDATGKIVDFTCIMFTHPEVIAEWKQRGGNSQDIQYLVQYFQQVSQVYGFERVDTLVGARKQQAHDPLDPRILFSHNNAIPTLGFELRDGPWEPTGLPQVQEEWKKGHKFFDIVYFRRSHEVIPIGASLKYIVDNMLNHYRHEHLDAFLQHEVSGPTIWNNLPDQHKELWEHFRVSTGSYQSNFLVKRRKLRQTQLIDQYGSDAVLDFYESDIKLRDLGDIRVQKLKEAKPERGVLPKRMRENGTASSLQQQGDVASKKRSAVGASPSRVEKGPRPSLLAPAPSRQQAAGLLPRLSSSNHGHIHAETESLGSAKGGWQFARHVRGSLMRPFDSATPATTVFPPYPTQHPTPLDQHTHFATFNSQAIMPWERVYGVWAPEDPDQPASFAVRAQPPTQYSANTMQRMQPSEKFFDSPSNWRIEEVDIDGFDEWKSNKVGKTSIDSLGERTDTAPRLDTTTYRDITEDDIVAAWAEMEPEQSHFVLDAELEAEQEQPAPPTAEPEMKKNVLLEDAYLPTMHSLPHWEYRQMKEWDKAARAGYAKELRENGEYDLPVEGGLLVGGKVRIGDEGRVEKEEEDYDGLFNEVLTAPTEWFNPYR